MDVPCVARARCYKLEVVVESVVEFFEALLARVSMCVDGLECLDGCEAVAACTVFGVGVFDVAA